MRNEVKNRCLYKDACVIEKVRVRVLDLAGDAASSSWTRDNFSRREILEASRRRCPGEMLAARLACKRALASLLKREGYSKPFMFRRVEILNHSDGRPYIEAKDRGLNSFISRRGLSLKMSLAHTRHYGVAAVAI